MVGKQLLQIATGLAALLQPTGPFPSFLPPFASIKKVLSDDAAAGRRTMTRGRTSTGSSRQRTRPGQVGRAGRAQHRRTARPPAGNPFFSAGQFVLLLLFFQHAKGFRLGPADSFSSKTCRGDSGSAVPNSATASHAAPRPALPLHRDKELSRRSSAPRGPTLLCCRALEDRWRPTAPHAGSGPRRRAVRGQSALKLRFSAVSNLLSAFKTARGCALKRV